MTHLVIIQGISHPRFKTYLSAAGHDPVRALKLYEWNARLGAAFFFPLQAVEVTLRNRMSLVFESEFGPDWPFSCEFMEVLPDKRKTDLRNARKWALKNKERAGVDDVIVNLSLGFWIRLFDGQLNAPIWSRRLLSVFPHLPEQEHRPALYRRVHRVLDLRNRLFHHEPLIRTDAGALYSDLLNLLKWMCPQTAHWVRPQCNVPELMRRKP